MHAKRDVKKELRERRLAARREMEATIAAMPDHDLRNLAKELGREMNQQANVLNEIRTRLQAVKGEIERRATATDRGLQISDHAVVRYLERHKGVDMKAVREEIAELALRARDAAGAGDPDQYARHLDGRTGLAVGVNEITGMVTTVFTPDENHLVAPTK